MPIYEYQCSECGVRFDRMQKFADDPVKVCPECGGETRRLIQPAGVIFKGSGFYVTDNRGSRAKSATNGKKDSAEDKKVSAEDKQDSTGSKKAESKSEGKAKSTESKNASADD